PTVRQVVIIPHLAAIVVRQLRDRRVLEHAVEMAGQEIRIDQGGSPCGTAALVDRAGRSKVQHIGATDHRNTPGAEPRCSGALRETSRRADRARSARRAAPRWRLAYRKLLA